MTSRWQRSGTSVLFTLILCGLAPGRVTAHESEPPARRPPGKLESLPGPNEVFPPLGWDTMTGDWLGARSGLEDRGIVIEPWLVLDYSRNFRGGVNTSDPACRQLWGLDMTLDTRTLFGLEGGTLFMEYYLHHGRDGSLDTGDFQVYDNIDADGRSQVAELWYEQRLWEDRIRFKIGKVDANSEFAYVENGLEHIHSSPGFTPSIMAFPSYPDPAMSVNLFLYPVESLYLGYGLYDGAVAHGVKTGELGPGTWGHRDWFHIMEGGCTWSAGDPVLDGRLGIGGWYHSADFQRFDGGTQHGTGGWYVLLDQKLYRESPKDHQGIGGFFVYGRGDRAVNEVAHHVSTGIEWTGLVDTRDNDVLGAGWNWVAFTSEPGAGFTESGETAWELFYRFQLTPWLSIKPDIQYIANPGGAGLGDAVVGTLRFEVLF